MTISSLKKPSKHRNRNRSTNQDEQQQHHQTNGSFSTRSTISSEKEDDDALTSGTDDDKNENIASSSSLTTTVVNNDSRSMTTATVSPICATRLTQKSHYSSSRSKPMSKEQNQTQRTHFDQHFRNSSGSDSSNDDSLDENSNEHANSSRKPVLKTVTSSKLVKSLDQFNSEDEYEHEHTTSKLDRDHANELDLRFARTLKEKKGFVIKPVREDGACLFRAVSDQVFGDEEMHETVRKNCMDYIVKNADFFRAYITEDFDHYVTRKRRHDCHGNHIEMIALSELYNRPIEVYEYRLEPINVVHGMFKTDNEPIRLSYHGGVHYNSIIDPWRPTAGHGLGLPDLEPGRAQEALIDTAVQQSEVAHIEHTLLNDEIVKTDLAATQDEILRQIAQESYLQWLHEQEKQSTMDSTISSSNPPDIASKEGAYERTETDARGASHSVLPSEYDESHLVTSELIDDDESLMKQVLALSCIEYVESFKKPTDIKDTDR